MNGMHWWRAARLTPVMAMLAVACAKSPTVATPQTSVTLAAPPATALSEPLPNLPAVSSASGLSEARGPVLKSLSANGQDLGEVIKVIASQFGLQYQIDPTVRGPVTTTLRNKTVTEALDAILPQGFVYEVRGGVLRVGPARLETRIFTMDYVALARIGTASTIIQRRLGTGTGGIGGLTAGVGATQAGLGTAGAGAGGTAFGGLGGGADVISATSVADVWEDIRVAVDALTFDQPTTMQGAQGSQAFAGQGGAAIGGRPYTRMDESGRRLIVNPIAGTITVTAMPAQLAQIETFIQTFEASIQRQVLIEAKIVEVNLDRSFEFGIDWNVVAGSRSLNLTPGAGRLGSNVQLTLNGGGTQITAVLTALAGQGDVRVLSSPRVSALNNQRAVFNVTSGEIVFVQTSLPVQSPNGTTTFTTTVTPQQVNVGIVLDVLPQIGADNTVTMNIRPVVTSVARIASQTNADGSRNEAPVIDTRESDTMARLRAGETIIIGGLMQNRIEKQRSGVPVLRSIPLLGRAFSRTVEIERKAELVIFLTPTIIAGQPPAAR